MTDKKLSSTIIGKAQLRAATIRSVVFFALISIFTVTSHYKFRSSPFTLFILFFLVERVYESYFTVKKCADNNLSQDRHLNNIILAFCIMVFGAVAEFYLYRRPIVPAWTILGFLLLLISAYLRWSAIKTVGDDWAIDTFAVPSRIRNHGPYRHVRHPYYLGVFFEAVAFPTIINSWYTLLFSVFVVAPLEGYRAILEEKVLVEKYGWIYIRFKREVNRFFPTVPKRTVYERRQGTGERSDEKRGKQERRYREERPPLDIDRRRIIKG